MTSALDQQNRQPTASKVVLGLSRDGLEAYPGAALVLNGDGAVIHANDRAELLLEAMRNGQLGDLAALTRATRPTIVSLRSGANTVVLELAALPADGGHFLVLARDVTLERNLRSALVESRQRYKDLVDISSDFAWEVGADGRFVFVSPKGALGFSADELVGRDPGEFVVETPADTESAPFASALALEDVEVWMNQADGSQACVLASSTPIRSESGEWLGARGICRDITQERLRDAALSRANNRERLLSYIVRTIRDEVDPVDMLRAAAEATARALGATGCQIFRLLPDASDFALAAQFGEGGDEKRALDSFIETDHFEERDGPWHVLSTVSRYRHSINGAILLWRDDQRQGWSDDDRLLIDDVANQVGLANEQIANHERILRLSRTDSLTGLFNRRAFFEEIARRFQRLSREHKPAALIYVDLDNFKAVNDVHGHQTGDQALLAVRDLLLHHTRPTDLVARLGGDEFAIWLEAAEENIAIKRCEGMLEASSTLAHFSGSSDKPLHMSLGVAVHAGASGESLEDLIARADKAMYEVKRDGKGHWRLAPAPTAATGD
ncbi:sensor domain-containing diguanylate cyclase [Magnetospirillum sp. 64-120]|uniref:sensor domain-containing diguanylate cyclase n=1 Tax=Magnetospirillum sp. 64-120 TaxID=1895778 RepID=UPI000927D111|nr:sensor domain-containing diguanylate cyclase [Magnetospirillum sp. 64-120]OJX70263.1 MAG: diguanylate cyclase [Magnetospirillum sp. 64-120]